MVRLHGESSIGTATRRLARAVFAERQVIVRTDGRVRCVNLNRIVQGLLGILAVAAVGWSGFASTEYARLTREAAEKDVRIALAERVNAALRTDMDDTRRQFLEIAGTLEKNHDHLVTQVEQNRALKGNLVSLQRKLRNAEAQRQATDADSQHLRRQLSALENQMREATSRNALLANDLQSTESELNAARERHSKERQRGKQLEERVVKLRGRLDSVRNSQTELLERLTRAASGDIDRVSALIEKTGLDVEDLLADRAKVSEKLVKSEGQGGPFLPATDSLATAGFGEGVDAFNAQMDRWNDVQGLLRRLPLVAPVPRYRVTSGFGNRKDPINGKRGFHSGLDLAAPINHKVRATAPGRVVRAGWWGRYGRFVEIDHGLGIRTRYGHLAKVLVKKGQTVKFRDPVGRLGSSGRSTGPHLHYEIVVDGKPVDPRKFLRAGKHVFKG